MLAVNHLIGFGGRRALAAPVIYAPSYWNTGGLGDRTGAFTSTTTATFGAGVISNLIDGVYADNNSDGLFFNSGQSSREIKWDLGTAYCITGMRLSQGTAGSHGTWAVEGSNDNSSWTTITSITFGSTAGAFGNWTWTNATDYRYYRLRQTAGTTNSGPWLREVEFKIGNVGGTARDTLEDGNRSSAITVTTTASVTGSIGVLVDGSMGQSLFFANGQTTKEIKFDLGSGVAKVFTGFTWMQDSNATHGTWVIEGSNDNSSWTQLGSSFDLGQTQVISHVTFANSTAYRYYKLRQTAGTTSSGPFLLEIEFRIA